MQTLIFRNACSSVTHCTSNNHILPTFNHTQQKTWT